MSGASKFSCPSNGTFYACDYGERFLGCCSNENADDTCTNGCPQSGLRAASFPKEDYDNTPVNSCTSGQWWTCADTSPPFLGCCKSNPCLAAGCPMGDLTAAVLSTLDADKAPYSPIQAPVSRSTSSSAASASSASASVSAASTPSSLGVQPTTTSTSSHKIPSGAVAGGVVGGVLGVGFLVGILICYRRRKARRGSGTDENGRENGRGLIGMVLSCFRKNDLGANGTGKTEKEGVEDPAFQSPPPYLLLPTPAPVDANPQNSTPVPTIREEDNQARHELAPDEAPLPEIGTSDAPGRLYELSSTEYQAHPYQPARASRANALGFRPYRPSGVSSLHGQSFASPSIGSRISSIEYPDAGPRF